jgi:hypothetical protein
MTMICFVLSNITEENIATYNTFPWVIFLAAFVYAMPAPKSKVAPTFGYGQVAGPTSTSETPVRGQ